MSERPTRSDLPNPSEKYLETVCVAGVRLDRGQLEWIHPYPVRFRNEDFDRTSKKYDPVQVNGNYRQTNGNRPESFPPRQDCRRNPIGGLRVSLVRMLNRVCLRGREYWVDY
ncbi:hypothetical protein MCEL_03510 [Mycolicibacterium celeriflavum]|uniref:Uncharacterized protein n=1 Tax=Mycolicibacterium celeriflavum TaxID=1249101 RepID=A0A7I7RD96_MYCCF|nr:hypothetical protein MCEL_03510 [Mycolicibacterium celeriflavum]